MQPWAMLIEIKSIEEERQQLHGILESSVPFWAPWSRQDLKLESVRGEHLKWWQHARSHLRKVVKRTKDIYAWRRRLRGGHKWKWEKSRQSGKRAWGAISSGRSWFPQGKKKSQSLLKSWHLENKQIISKDDPIPPMISVKDANLWMQLCLFVKPPPSPAGAPPPGSRPCSTCSVNLLGMSCALQFSSVLFP